uniref:Uncharacterized protein n=1 Tax=Siphoviridae sp. ctzAk96 TaxID=2826527 RepID=A0A8S5QWS9_9CAUD|nr:MAG TPA: hypothetical protein [Siphoviridae sp. ctzAk96]
MVCSVPVRDYCRLGPQRSYENKRPNRTLFPG